MCRSSRSAPIEETLEALDELVREGKICCIGVSNETAWGVMEYRRAAKEKNYPKTVSIQNQYILANRTFELGLAEVSIKEQVGLLVYSPLGMGALTSKYLDGARPARRRSIPLNFYILRVT